MCCRQALLLSLVLLLLLAACVRPEHPYYMARAEIPIGMPIKEAVASLDGVWHHAECPYNGVDESTTHLLLFGSRDIGRAAMIWVEAIGPRDAQVVAGMGIVDDSMRGVYDHCIKLDRS